MALVECRECGERVSDAAVTCPRCGVDEPAGMGRLLVTRQKQLFAAVHSVSVAIDGVVVGKLKSGGELALDLAPGRHQLLLSYSKAETSGQVLVKSGRTATCHAAVSKFDSSLKVSIQDE
jgi:hypothetical protein